MALTPAFPEMDIPAAEGHGLGLTKKIDFQVADFSSLNLGREMRDVIYIDLDAAGYGWFVDETPQDDVEFGAGGSSEVEGKMDLLTAVMHELGHVLGYDDLDPETRDIMSSTLNEGERHVPGGDGGERVVVMDTAGLTDDAGEEPVLTARGKIRNSWIVDFLVKNEAPNPFDPQERISIVPTNDEEKE